MEASLRTIREAASWAALSKVPEQNLTHNFYILPLYFSRQSNAVSSI